jgi:palmitoyltransferase
VFHTYLALSNKTTWEVLSRKKITYLNNMPENYNPFTLGVRGNLYFYCCKRIN